MHRAAYEYVASVVRRFGVPERVVEIGSRDINGTVRPLFAGCKHYVGLDLRPGPAVDVVADACTWRPWPLVDCVVCCEVLEHTPRAREIVASAHAMLREGGLLILTAACDPRHPHSALDGGPVRDGEYYRNVDPADLHDWLRAFGACEIETTPLGDIRAWAVK